MITDMQPFSPIGKVVSMEDLVFANAANNFERVERILKKGS